MAIRPFVTDDARVVGAKLAQLETWALIDEAQAAQSALFALGPTPWLELTLGSVQGVAYAGAGRGFSITGPIAQGKALVLTPVDGGRPGLALAAGVLPPWGYGRFVPPGLGAFAFAAATESLFDEGLLIHANLGYATADEPDGRKGTVTAGIGAQVRVLGGFHGVGEVYYADPYDPTLTVPATQIGFRYIFSDQVQVDGTFGAAFDPGGREDATTSGTRVWGTLGVRLVSPELW
jgi:hypothetical protein